MVLFCTSRISSEKNYKYLQNNTKFISITYLKRERKREFNFYSTPLNSKLRNFASMLGKLYDYISRWKAIPLDNWNINIYVSSFLATTGWEMCLKCEFCYLICGHKKISRSFCWQLANCTIQTQSHYRLHTWIQFRHPHNLIFDRIL